MSDTRMRDTDAGPYRTPEKPEAPVLLPLTFREGVSRVAVWMTRALLLGTMLAGLIGASAGLVAECKKPDPPPKPTVCVPYATLDSHSSDVRFCPGGRIETQVVNGDSLVIRCVCGDASEAKDGGSDG